jgi:hypothetical protein
VLHVVVEAKATVAVVALHLFTKKQRLAALGRFADGVGSSAYL